MKRLVGLGLVFAGGLGCAADTGELPPSSQSNPLIGGEEVGEGGDPAVIALTSRGFPFCTGTLISPSVVLTAAHCIDMGGDNTVHFGHDVQAEGRNIRVSSTTTHPDWNGSLGNNDIGVILLAIPQDPGLPVPMNTSPASDHIDDPYRIVGFGTYDIVDGMTLADGKKRAGVSTITGVTAGDVLLTGDAVIRVCFGDSGGPGFLDIEGTEYVAGVHSYTSDSQCSAPMGDTRVDRHVDNFLQPFIDANDPACTRNGVCSQIGCIDDPDCEPCGPDGTCVTDCELPDWDCATQGMGEVCQANSQCTTGICVFWQQQPETKFCTEECDLDVDCPSEMTCVSRPDVGKVCYYDNDPPGLVGAECATAGDCGSLVCEESVCTTPCDMNAGLLCPLGFLCENRSGEFRCYEADVGGGGCAIADTGGNPGATAWLALFALIALRRKHST